MATTNSKTVARDVAADLIGGSPKKTVAKKTAVKKAVVKKGAQTPGSRATDEQKIKIVKDYDARKGSNRAKLFAIMRKCGTVGNYKKQKAQAGLGKGVGGFLAKMERDRFIRISA